VGIPIEVRHVTFVTGQLTFAAMTLGPQAMFHADFLWAMSTIGLIALCNFGVSFSLALFVALRAREVGVRAQIDLVGEVLRHLRRAPMDFLRTP
jgi:site-specific recombinase